MHYWSTEFSDLSLRYIYIPLGGTKNVAFTMLLVFTFVALWHDLSFRLLAWGWLVSLFIVPELLARYVLHPSKVRRASDKIRIPRILTRRLQFGNKPWYRHVCAVGAVFNILMMVAANLVGFVIGTDGVSYMLQQLLGTTEGKLRAHDGVKKSR